MHYLRPSSLAQLENYFHSPLHIHTLDPRHLPTRHNFMGLGVPAEGKIPEEYPLGSTMSGKNTAVPSSSHTGGFAGAVFIPKPDPQLSRGQCALLRNPKHGPTAPARAFPSPKSLPVQGDIPASKCNTGRSCSHTLLDKTKKHFWRPHSIALF